MYTKIFSLIHPVKSFHPNFETAEVFIWGLNNLVTGVGQTKNVATPLEFLTSFALITNIVSNVLICHVIVSSVGGFGLHFLHQL